MSRRFERNLWTVPLCTPENIVAELQDMPPCVTFVFSGWNYQFFQVSHGGQTMPSIGPGDVVDVTDVTDPKVISLKEGEC